MRTLFALAALILAAPTVLAQTAEGTLEHVRPELGLSHLADFPNGLIIRGKETGYYGEDLDWECTFDSQRFRIARTGRLTEITTCDGTEAWTQEIGGEVRPCELGDLELARVEVGVISGLLLAQGGPHKFHLDKERTDAAQITLTTDLDQGRASAAVNIERITWRPRRWTLSIGQRTGTFDLEDSITFGGLKLPRTIHEGQTTLTITKVEAASKDDARYRLTPGIPSDSTFNSKAPALLECKANSAKCLLVKPLINGKEVGWFLLDTGTQLNVIDPEVAKQAGLETFGEATVTGVAVHNGPGRFCRAKTLTLGPLEVQGPLLLSSKLPHDAAGDNISGILGLPLFMRCVVEMQADAPRVRIYDLTTYKLPQGQWLPLHTNRYMPLIPGKFEDHDAVFRLDTGSGDTVVMDEPTKRLWKLNEHGPIRITAKDAVDGPNPLMEITAKSIALGHSVGHNVPVRVAANPSGKFTDTYSNGVVGMGFGHGFVFVIDYQHTRIAAEPEAGWPPLPR